MEPRLLQLWREYGQYQAQGWKLDMTRGKPNSEQLDLSDPMLEIRARYSPTGIDCGNYGGLEGIPEARVFFANYLGVPPEQVLVQGNSSLELMANVVKHALKRDFLGCAVPWDHFKPHFICPAPGYDRHFTICEENDIGMHIVPMTDQGPEMGAVRELVTDPNVVGMWCVPKYSNPTGVTYSERVVEELAMMPVANPAFRIFWDNAYAVHDLFPDADHLASVYPRAVKVGKADRFFIFGSTSKITFAGGGIAAVASSVGNIAWFKDWLRAQTIGPDKMNQLRHVLFLKDMSGVRDHMAKHRQILKPKFDAVIGVLRARLGGEIMASWTEPKGGYFISLDVGIDRAKRVVQLAADAGVLLTPAGATFPYQHDPADCNIRIAPSFPPVKDVRQAMEVVATCIEIAHWEGKAQRNSQA